MTADTDLDAFVEIPRVSGLWLSPDGDRLVTGVATADRSRNRYVTALWALDPTGSRSARRLTRSAQGESAAAFTPSGDLLFVSARPEAGDDPGDVGVLWRQPATGGDAHVLAAPGGGVRGVVVSDSGRVVLGSALLPSATGQDSDTELRMSREDAAVTAILHEDHPVRHWDHDLGPGRTRLLTAELADGDESLELTDLTGHVDGALDDECTWQITPDGHTVVAEWVVAEPAGARRRTLVAIDIATGARRTLADDPDHDYTEPRVSPDGTRVAVQVRRRFTPEDAGDSWLGVVSLDGGPLHALSERWDRWPHDARWTPDGASLLVAADDQGRSPLWRLDAASGEPTRLTGDDGAYTDVRISPDGRWAYALRSTIADPPAPVRVALDGTGAIEALPSPGGEPEVPGRLEEVTTTAEDGTPLRAWLALPQGADAGAPAPLLLQIHGGPLASTNAWSWRWNPWIWATRGYAVLLPDPALSTGYGIEFIRRGWATWGGAPYTDLMRITDAAQQRPEIDASRSAAVGASFGGYMANWIAGHTDRFDAIVTHASLWALDQKRPTGDVAHHFVRQMSEEAADANSPHRFADAITTPMLVVHGNRDYRVPIGEALRLWWDLAARTKERPGPHKFLYFPDENHWVLTPNHAHVWYSTVLAFLDHHLRGRPWRRHHLLG